MTKTKIELIEQRKQIRETAENLVKTAETEKRELNVDENDMLTEYRAQIENINKEIENLDKQLEDEKRQADQNEKRNSIHKDMNKFSLVDEIRSIVDGKKQDRKIEMPAFENREYTKTQDAGGKGGEDVATVIEGLLTPLYDNQVLGNFTWMTGLTSDVKIPRIGANNVGWADEIEAASATDSSVESVTLKPKRLTAYVDLSKMLLMQANANLEAVVREDIQKAVADKLQKTLLGDAAGSNIKPAGLFYEAETLEAVNFANIINIEKTVEESNAVATGYIINPSVKATCRAAVKAQGQGGFLFEGGELDGMPTAVTNAAGGILYGNLKDIVIGQFGNVSILVDPYSKAVNDEVRLVINFYVDAANRRPGENTVVAKKV